MTTKFEAFNGADGKGYDAWLALWRDWPDREVFSHPDYIRPFCRPGDAPVALAFFSDEGQVLFPLIRRPLAIEPWAQDAGPASDLVSAYGYGGAYRRGRPDEAAFRRAFEQWAGAQGIATCFCRLSVVESQILPFFGETRQRSRNIIRSLEPELPEIWSDYEYKVRKNVAKARREGVTVEVDPSGRHLDRFLDIYRRTMDRRQAQAHYYFPEEFFLSIIRNLAGHFCFFHAFHKGEIVSTELVLVSSRTLYSYLGGTLDGAFDVRPNDLLKHSIVEWGKDQKKTAFVLGGGYAPDDGIFRYKKSFAPNGEVPFFVGEWIRDRALYEALIRSRGAYEAGQGRAWAPNPSYFPAYRG